MSYCQSLAPINYFTTVAHTREICLAKLVIKSSSVSLGLTVCVLVSWCVTSHQVHLSAECFDATTSDEQNNTQIFKLIGKSVKMCVYTCLCCALSLAPRPVCVVWGNETGDEAEPSLVLRWVLQQSIGPELNDLCKPTNILIGWIIFVWIYNSSLAMKGAYHDSCRATSQQRKNCSNHSQILQYVSSDDCVSLHLLWCNF